MVVNRITTMGGRAGGGARSGGGGGSTQYGREGRLASRLLGEKTGARIGFMTSFAKDRPDVLPSGRKSYTVGIEGAFGNASKTFYSKAAANKFISSLKKGGVPVSDGKSYMSSFQGGDLYK